MIHYWVRDKIVFLLSALTLGACSDARREVPAPTEDARETPTVEDRTTKEPWTPAAGFPLTEVAAAAGVDFVHFNGAEGRRYYVETMSPGAALFDADGDATLQGKLETKQTFEEGLDLYFERRFAEAAMKFNQASEACPPWQAKAPVFLAP